MAVAMPTQNAGSSYYTPFFLKLYDLWVVWISNDWAWHCSGSRVQLPLFTSVLGKKHLDIGVGTGYYPAKAVRKTTACRDITLADLNPSALEEASTRILSTNKDINVRTVVVDVMAPWPLAKSEKFDSVSIFYLLHCVAGPPERKTHVFDYAREHVADNGVLVGTTILGEEIPMNWFARCLMGFYNEKGIFDNWKDNRAVFEAGLRRNFDEVDIQVIGRVLIFTARRPIKVTPSTHEDSRTD